MKLPILLLPIVLFVHGCAGQSPPNTPPLKPATMPSAVYQLSDQSDHNRHLWAYGLIKVNDDHSQWEYVPYRELNFHLNALKLLESSSCINCVTITNVKKLGNGLVDVDVQIKHPFPGLLKYTAFDVKGIVMFKGSKSIGGSDHSWVIYKEHPELFPLRINLSFLGDWELLNEDGFSNRWSPSYISGQDAPMFSYIQGKLSSGLPDSNINAYKNYYSTEERHMFIPGQAVTSTYHIQTQPGGMTMGYAVEACWEPPTVNPVTNPASDFPLSANQYEPYVERYYLNDDQPITKPHTEIREYPFYAQYRQWNTGRPNNATNEFDAYYFLSNKWYSGVQFPNVVLDTWMVGPEPDTEDIYKLVNSKGDWVTFSPFGIYNSYWVWIRFSWYEENDDNGYPILWTNFNPSIQVVQINIPGNDP